MATRTERNTLFRNYHYKWQQFKGSWFLIGPDGWRTTEEEAEQAIQQIQSSSITSAQWAQTLIEQRPLILDTETTGLDPAKDEIIDIALVELDGTVLVNTLVQCRGTVPADATRIHGISNEMLQGQPTFPQMWEQLRPHLSRPLVIYNAAYDIPMLAYNALNYKIRMSRPQAHCLMTHFTDYSVGLGGPYQKLATACQHFHITPGGHRALSDAQAARQVLLHLAQTNA
jgi:DNA polymerase III subunit epsilon